MSRLNKLYAAMKTLRKEGLPVGEDLERKDVLFVANFAPRKMMGIESQVG